MWLMACRPFVLSKDRLPANSLNCKWTSTSTSKINIHRSSTQRTNYFQWPILSRLVIDTLEKVERDRKCFRLVGGVLVERSVGEVQPALTGNRDKLTKLIETLEKQLTEKGQEINGYIEKHNIQIQGKKGPTTSNAPAVDENKKTPSTGVLVWFNTHYS